MTMKSGHGFMLSHKYKVYKMIRYHKQFGLHNLSQYVDLQEGQGHSLYNLRHSLEAFIQVCQDPLTCLRRGLPACFEHVSSMVNVIVNVCMIMNALNTQTHKKFKRTLIYYDTDTQSANCRGNPFRQATKLQNDT